MKIAANPAVSSSDAGISAISSRLRALIRRLRLAVPVAPALASCGGSSSGQSSVFGRLHEALRVVLGPQLVGRERRAAALREALQGDSGVADRRVEPDPEREVVRKALVEGDDV